MNTGGGSGASSIVRSCVCTPSLFLKAAAFLFADCCFGDCQRCLNFGYCYAGLGLFLRMEWFDRT